MKDAVRNQVWTVLRTTLIDQSRDRRSVGAAFLYALSGPLMLLAMFMMMGSAQDEEQPPRVAVYGAEHAPQIVESLREGGAQVEQRAGDPAALARTPPEDLGEATVVLLVNPEFRQAIQGEASGTLTVLRDERSRRSMADARRVQDQLHGHAQEMAAERLTRRGIEPEIAQPLTIESVNIAPTGGNNLSTARLVLMFLILAPFFTSMTAAIDATAGERERQSLKPLLAQPVSPASIILGKWAVSSLFGIAGTIGTVVLGLFLLRFAPLDTLKIDLRMDALTQVVMILLLIPLALLVAALQSLVAMLAKSFKEAQTYIQLLTFAPLAILMIGTFSDQATSGPSSNLPVIGHAELMTTLLAEGKMDAMQALAMTATTLLLTLAALVWSQKQLSNEKLMSSL